MAEFEDITIGQLTFKFNQPEKEIAVDIPIAGGIATLTSKPINISTYDVIVKIKEEKKFSFKTDKMITAIGSNTNNKYYKLLSGNMEKQSIVPDYEGENFKEKFNNFCFDLLNAEGDIINVTNSSRWQVKDKEVKKQSWAEVSESIEEFSIDIKTEGSEILKNGNLIDEILKVAELKAVGQEDNTALVTLIALSSFLDDSVHHISTGPPGTSKSTITDTIFDIFPSQRKESIGKSSTPASLSNMTIYEEGPQVLSRKFIRIGDLGNEEEIKAALPLLSIFKELMSKKKYDKTISIPQGDTHITKRLKISGVGSVHLSTIESNVESQYDSRAIISSPNDTSETAKTHQLNDVDRLLNDKEFKKRRLPIAAAIESLCQFIEGLESNHGDVQFANPYAHHMNEIFNIDSSKNVNRNRNHIRDLPKSVTLANIKNREIWIHEVDKDVKILITPEDYLYSLKIIIGKPILKMFSDISPQQQSYIRFIEENYVFTEEGKPKDLDYYNEFAIGESSYSDERWISKITSDVCFCKKDVTSGLGVSETTASRMLDDLCERRVIFKHQIKKNYYFPTNEFFQYSKTYSPEFFKDEELEIGGEVHQIARKEYEAAIQILKGAGYINQPISRSVFGRYK